MLLLQPISKIILFLEYTVRDGAVVARRAHNPKVIGSSPIPATSNNRKALYLQGFSYLRGVIKL